MIRMFPDCEQCHLHYEREPGYFLGSIYINYGLTAVLVTVGYLALFFSGWSCRRKPRCGSWLAFAVLFPMWFFRYAQPVAGIRHYWDPRTRQRAKLARLALRRS